MEWDIHGEDSYPPKESSLKILSEGSHWFECSLLPSVTFWFFWFSLKNPSHYCVVGGGGEVVGGAYLKVALVILA